MLGAEDLSIIGLTLRIATISTLCILPFGIAAAWFLSRYRGLGKGMIETFLSLPLVLPPTAVGLVLLELLGRGGPLGRLFDDLGIDVAFTWRAAALASGIMSFPLLVKPLRAAFEEIDPRLLGVARTLGRGPVYVFFGVALPIAWRGLFTGALMAFSRALGEFGATVLVAGNIPGRTQTLALAIFQRSEIGHDHAAMRLALITVLIAFVVIWLTEAATSHQTGRLRQ